MYTDITDITDITDPGHPKHQEFLQSLAVERTYERRAREALRADAAGVFEYGGRYFVATAADFASIGRLIEVGYEDEPEPEELGRRLDTCADGAALWDLLRSLPEPA